MLNNSAALRLAALAAIALLTTACDAPRSLTAAPAQAESTAGEERPPFTQETVLKLNPIVARSKAALDRYDSILPQLAAARESGDDAQVEALIRELATLKDAADQAHKEFQAEQAALLTRDEHYDEVILATMEQFVAEAPAEIAEAIGKRGD